MGVADVLLSLQAAVVTTTLLIRLAAETVAAELAILAAIVLAVRARAAEVGLWAAVVAAADVRLLAELTSGGATISLAAGIVRRGPEWPAGFALPACAALAAVRALGAAALRVPAEYVVRHAGPVVAALPVERAAVGATVQVAGRRLADCLVHSADLIRRQRRVGAFRGAGIIRRHSGKYNE